MEGHFKLAGTRQRAAAGSVIVPFPFVLLNSLYDHDNLQHMGFGLGLSLVLSWVQNKRVRLDKLTSCERTQLRIQFVILYIMVTGLSRVQLKKKSNSNKPRNLLKLCFFTWLNKTQHFVQGIRVNFIGKNAIRANHGIKRARRTKRWLCFQWCVK